LAIIERPLLAHRGRPQEYSVPGR